MPAEGTKMKTRPWPGRWPLYGVMEKVKDVSNDLTVDEFEDVKKLLRFLLEFRRNFPGFLRDFLAGHSFRFTN
ncbi:hypothetical protein WN944_008274 [Citrus x changshan-huyou]|uniref:Uncharacterized protein n=1 Tax=Citrus x changshan-huyou TaxID=2935761 RepID=A0AAP0MPH3_9ROSI